MEWSNTGGAKRAKTGITITLALAMLLAALGTSIANIALPTLAAAFSAPFAQVHMVVVAYLAALTVSVPVAGRLGDRRGLRLMLVAGLAVFALASLLCAIAPSLRLLIGARALQGIGAAFLITIAIIVLTPGYQLFQAANNTAALADVAQDRRGTVSGLLGLSRNIGLIAGASAMGAVFAFGVGTEELARATPLAIASGMRLTFLLAAARMLAAIAVTLERATPLNARVDRHDPCKQCRNPPLHNRSRAASGHNVRAPSS